MNYPNKKSKNLTKIVSYSNRGMTLEDDINKTNTYYLENDIAIIYKKPTPIRVVKVDYNKRINTVIREAYYEIPSTTDYNGIYKGKYIDFDAKETTSKTSFPIKNVHKHQIKHLVSVRNHGGIAFLIIRLNCYGETYLLDIKYIVDFINNNERKSIPFDYIRQNGHLIEEKYIPRVNYIKVIEEYYMGVKK